MVRRAAMDDHHRIKVIVVQHAEKSVGGWDPGLSERGMRQARRTADALLGEGISATIFSSQLRRARETAGAIATASGRPVAVDDRLSERVVWDPGATLTLEEFLEEWERSTVDRDYAPAGGDSSRQAARRFRSFLEELASSHDDTETAVVVSHGGVTTDLLRDVLGDEELERRALGLIKNGVPGCAVTILIIDGGTIHVETVASIGHLPAPDRSGHQR
jgi:broad specificity phosphatase PhoE